MIFAQAASSSGDSKWENHQENTRSAFQQIHNDFAKTEHESLVANVIWQNIFGSIISWQTIRG